MKKLKFKPFNKVQLIEKLRTEFPQYKIQTSFGNLQVRTSGFTATGNVQIITKPKSGKVTTKTNMDNVVIFIIFLLPLGIYIWSKREKQRAMEKEVVAKLEEILEK